MLKHVNNLILKEKPGDTLTEKKPFWTTQLRPIMKRSYSSYPEQELILIIF